MRVLYGCNAQGHGHLSKAATLVPIIAAAGHEVRVVTSGLAMPGGYEFPNHSHFAGLPFSVAGGRAVVRNTLKSWAKRLPAVTASLAKVRGLVRDFEPDLILSDFELLTASPAVGADCEVVSLCRQVALFDPGVPLPPPGPDAAELRQLTKVVIRLFTLGADRYHGYHYRWDSPRCVPPVIRPRLLETPTRRGDFLLVYNAHHWTDGGDTQSLLTWAARTRREVVVYGHQAHPRGRFGTVTFREPSREGMLSDLAACRAVVATAGLTTPAEAFLLDKPCGVVPLPGQWEQRANAWHLGRAGMAAWLPAWDYDAAWELPEPVADERLTAWLTTPAATVLEQVRPGLGRANAG